jgi:acyl carrier protein
MDVFADIKEILIDLLDIPDREITPETYLIQDLGAESIDLLELAVAINSTFKINVKDDEIFLTRFRLFMTEAQLQKQDIIPYIAGKYRFLTEDRIGEVIAQIDAGPQLKIKDLISYIEFQLNSA